MQRLNLEHVVTGHADDKQQIRNLRTYVSRSKEQTKNQETLRLRKANEKTRVGCAPPRTTKSGRRRLTWKKDLTAAPAPGGRSFRRSGPCRPSREGTAGLESDPTHQKTGVENGSSSSTVGDNITSAMKLKALRPRRDKQKCMRGCEGLNQMKRTKKKLQRVKQRYTSPRSIPGDSRRF